MLMSLFVGLCMAETVPYEYTITDNSAHTVGIRKYLGDKNRIEIPSVIYINGTEYTVTSIDTAGFYGLSSITVPSTVTTIAFNAFSGVTHVVYNGTASGSPWDAIIVNGEIDGDFVYTDQYKDYLAAFIGTDTLARIPDNVRIIGPKAFANNHIIKTVVMSAVDSIENNAFASCSSLSYITLPNSVVKIGQYAFGWCTSLKRITIPTSVVIMGNSVFSGCDNLTIYCDASSKPEGWHNNWVASWNPCPVVWNVPDYSMYEYIITNENAHTVGIRKYLGDKNRIEIPSVIYINGTEYTVTSIDTAGFYGLSSITVPSTVTTIAFNAFSGVTHVVYNGTASGSPWDAIIVNGEIDGDFVYTDQYKDYLAAFIGTDTLARIPDNVRIIGPKAFANNHIIKTVVMSAVDSIENNAFASCSSLSYITLPNSVVKIGQYAFGWCTSLKRITIPTSVVIMGNSVFSGCDNLTIYCDASSKPEGWHNNWVASWNPCPVVWNVPKSYSVTVSVNNPDYGTITGISEGATYHYGDSLFITAVPKSGYVFEGWDDGCTSALYITAVRGDISLTAYFRKLFDPNRIVGNLKYIITDTVAKTVELQGFAKNLSYLSIPDSIVSDGVQYSVTSIGFKAFSGCTGIDSVNIPASVKVICNQAFANCTGMVSMTIPNTVDSIGNNAFLKVKNIIYHGTAMGEPWGALTLNGTFDGDFIYSSDNLTVYTGTESVVAIPDSISTIGNSAFEGCTTVTEVVIPETVTEIGSNAFSGCENLSSVNIPTSVTSISEGAFANCSSLDSVAIPESVTEIGNGAFNSCTSLTVIDIPESVTSIGSDAFAGCSKLDTIVIPESVTEIGNNAFSGCTNLSSVNIPSSIQSINDGAFANCTSLDSIVLPENLTGIGSNAFSSCTSLSTIEIPESVENIGAAAFAGCVKLDSVIIPESVTAIGDSAFSGCTSLTSIGIPTSITAIGANTFSGCVKLDSVAIPESVTEIGSGAFNGCASLSSIDIPSSVTQIGDGAFAFCSSLETVQIGEIDSAENTFKSKIIALGNEDVVIGARAFYGCEGLKSVYIPISVTNIGDSAFAGCKNLTIYCEAKSKPEGWSDQWNPDNCKVVWAYNSVEELGTAVTESAATIVSIYACGNVIVVEDADAEVSVFDINGRMIAKAKAVSSRIELPMAIQGVYIVKVGNAVKRVAIN